MMAEVEMGMMMAEGDTTVDGDDKQNDAITETDKVQESDNHMIQGVTSFDTTVDAKPGDPNNPDRSLIRTIQDRSLIRTIQDRSLIRTIQDRSLIRTIQDRSLIRTIQDRSLIRTIQDRSLIRTIQDRSLIRTIQDRLGILELQNYMKIQNPFRK